MMGSDKRFLLSFSIVAIAILTGCDRMMTPAGTQTLKDAEANASRGDYLRAISLYEAAMDNTARCADIHYKLALLYDDKLNDPLNALHHFKRYLVLSPNGAHATEVKNYVQRDEVALVTSLSGDSVVTPVEAARLRNENLSLRQQLNGRAPPKTNQGPTKKNRRAAHHDQG
jgi:tetratricopeptide (TPR) repeat protein